jgi:hypothetical protein
MKICVYSPASSPKNHKRLSINRSFIRRSGDLHPACR